MQDLNLRPLPCEGSALATELIAPKQPFDSNEALFEPSRNERSCAMRQGLRAAHGLAALRWTRLTVAARLKQHDYGA